VESLATGNVVLSRVDRYGNIHPGCPVVNVNMDTLTNRLRHVILDRSLRHKLVSLGRMYVEKYYDDVVVVQRIIDGLKGSRDSNYVQPTFFSRFSMPDQLLKEERSRSRRMTLALLHPY